MGRMLDSFWSMCKFRYHTMKICNMTLYNQIELGKWVLDWHLVHLCVTNFIFLIKLYIILKSSHLI